MKGIPKADFQRIIAKIEKSNGFEMIVKRVRNEGDINRRRTYGLIHRSFNPEIFSTRKKAGRDSKRWQDGAGQTGFISYKKWLKKAYKHEADALTNPIRPPLVVEWIETSLVFQTKSNGEQLLGTATSKYVDHVDYMWKAQLAAIALSERDPNAGVAWARKIYGSEILLKSKMVMEALRKMKRYKSDHRRSIPLHNVHDEVGGFPLLCLVLVLFCPLTGIL